MTTKLRHHRLEEAIYGRRSVGSILGRATPELSHYVVADYVGSIQVDAGRFGEEDLIRAGAAGFFEDSGAYVKSYADPQDERALRLAVFATFLVVELRPYTPDTEFLVLTPPRPQDLQGAKYLGLMATQNTDQLVKDLDAREDPAPLFEDLRALITWLRAEDAAPTRRQGLLRRWLRR